MLDFSDRLEAYLRENAVPFEVRRHPRVVTGQGVAATEHIPGKMLAKTVMVLVDGEMIMLVLTDPDADKAYPLDRGRARPMCHGARRRRQPRCEEQHSSLEAAWETRDELLFMRSQSRRAT